MEPTASLQSQRDGEAREDPNPAFCGRQGGDQVTCVLGLALSATSSPGSQVYFICWMPQLWFQAKRPLPVTELMEPAQ